MYSDWRSDSSQVRYEIFLSEREHPIMILSIFGMMSTMSRDTHLL